MKEHIFRYLVLGVIALFAAACGDSEGDLLKPKVYFENIENNVTIEGESGTIDFALTSRLTNMTSSPVNVSYTIADVSAVKAYNEKYGTDYKAFDAAHAKLSASASTIANGQLYADNVTLTLSDLDKLKEGDSYMLPVRVKSSSVPTSPGTDITYVIFAKPISITHVGTFDENYISVKYPPNTFFSSFTYEALIYFNQFDYKSSTILGTEGLMILRVGDTGGGIAQNILQAAGTQHYEAQNGLEKKRWYHVALTYDRPTGKTALYVDGAKWAESAWNIAGFDPNSDIGFNIGMLPNFPWGQRAFNGYMSEVRVWSVARTENQLKQNMLGVDPKSDGLELYYKLNGTEKQEGGIITDAAKNLQGTTNGITIKKLDAPISIE